MKLMINNIMKAGVCVALLCVTSSCVSFLENESKTNLTDDSQWASPSSSDIFLNDVYSEIPNHNRLEETVDYYSDDYNISHYYTASNWRVGVCQAPPVSNDDVWNGTHGPTESYTWSKFFVKLRKCNMYIEKMTENKANFDEPFYNKRIDEVRFLRAFFYANMLMHYGGCPIITKTLDRNTMTEEEMQVPRSTFEETYNFIGKELEDIVKNEYLPIKYGPSSVDAGRATTGAALALKGWLDLFVASPLFNTSTPYLPDPKKHVHFGSFDKNRWAKAAATNKKFIDTFGNGTYDLFPDLANLWRTTNEYNEEIIWDRQIVANTGMASNYETRGGPTYVLGEYRSWGNYNPTQELVDDFLMDNGKPITDPTSGYDPQKPYENREKRFYDFIVYDGAPYKLDWMPREDTIYTRIDETYPNPDKTNQIDLAGKTDVGDSGYYQKKRLNQEAAPAGQASGQNFVFFRYAEVLLNYAEAQNEAVGPDNSVYEAINKLRLRSELPPLEGGLTQDQMREVIWKERRVELCFEGKRYFDNKRLAKAEQRIGTPRHNMVIRNSSPKDNSGTWIYSVEEEVKYVSKFEKKQYMTPIPMDAIDQNKNIDQNPGY